MNVTEAPDSADTGVYVHLPFCRLRCTYCAFAISTDLDRVSAYRDALLDEIRMRVSPGSSASSIYFGGGTPSLTPVEDVARIIEAIAERTPPAKDCEVTLEANPEDVTTESVEAWRSIGVNRLSLGIQSLEDRELFPLGRGHARARAIEAMAIAVDSGLRVSIDIILGLPLQSGESFRATLREVLSAGPGHLSMYLLDLEEGSVLEKRVRQGWKSLPDEDAITAAYVEAIDILSAAGLDQYEISNFARPGDQSRHNLRYWQRKPYLGLGLGAHSYDGSRRTANSRDLGEYVSMIGRGADATVFEEEIDPARERRERLFLGLRQVAGIDRKSFEVLTGKEGEEWKRVGIGEGWVLDRGDRIALTPRGFLVSNELISQLF